MRIDTARAMGCCVVLAVATACGEGEPQQQLVVTYTIPNIPMEDRDAEPPGDLGWACYAQGPGCIAGLTCVNEPCDPSAGPCAGTCTRRCDPGGGGCPDGYFCESDAVAGRPSWCMHRVPYGARCGVTLGDAEPWTPTNTCQEGSYCSPAGRCDLQMPPGDVCPGTGWRFDFACYAGYVCDAKSAMDRTPICKPVARQGDPCIDDDACAPELYCRNASSASACAPRLAEGLACAGQSARACMAGTTCAMPQGVCVALPIP